MRGRLLFLAGLATGYVLGSRAGRRAYERLAAKARDVWGDPNLQKVVAQTEQAAKDAASLAQAKVSELMDQATTAVGAEREKAATVVGDTAKAARATAKGARATAKDAAGKTEDVVNDTSAKVSDGVEDATRQSDTD